MLKRTPEIVRFSRVRVPRSRAIRPISAMLTAIDAGDTELAPLMMPRPNYNIHDVIFYK
jgi:hypothetical protein